VITKHVVASLLLGLIAAAPASDRAAAQSFPSRPIKLVVAFAPGGPNDVLARFIAQALSATLGPAVVDNRPGASGITGTRSVADAEPDGHTLLYGTTATLAVNPAIFRKLSYDPLRDFAPVALVSTSSNFLVVHPGLPAKTVQELIAYAKAHPGKLNYSSGGLGVPPHLVAEMFKQKTGTDIVHVAYRGGGPALADVVAGQVQMTFGNPANTLPFILGGQVRALAVTSATRNPLTPDVPTMIESGVPDFVESSFTGVLAPKGTPPAVVARLNAEINAALKNPELAAAFEKLGVSARPGSPEEFGTFLAGEVGKWGAVVRRAGISID
jgi:tripartite-type tricarboxylate transporter receptor subunit TctC